jgi:hypothetical protein
MSAASTLVDVVQSAEDVGVPEGDADGLQLGLGEPPPMSDSSGPGSPPDDELGEALAEADADPLGEDDGVAWSCGPPVGNGTGNADGLADALADELADGLAEALALAEGDVLLLGEPDGQLSAAIAPAPEAAVTSTVVAPVTRAMIPATNSPPDVRVRMQCSFVGKDGLTPCGVHRTAAVLGPSPLFGG